ncbi:MAG: periplasmic heavy metal sensor [Acidobacteria bacterium]|nr:periplasmic heavy metal sensor [Acidobacteriota bacterium]
MTVSRKTVIAAVCALLLTAGGAALLGQSPEPLPPEPPVFDDTGPLVDNPGLREELALSEAQIEQLRALGHEAAKTGIRHRADLAVKRMELEELLEAETPDRALVDKKLREISDLQHVMLKSRVDSRLALAGVLTPEQRAKLRSRLQDRARGRHGFRRGERGFGGRGFQERGFGPRGFGGRGGIPPRPEAPPAPQP